MEPDKVHLCGPRNIFWRRVIPNPDVLWPDPCTCPIWQTSLGKCRYPLLTKCEHLDNLVGLRYRHTWTQLQPAFIKHLHSTIKPGDMSLVMTLKAYVDSLDGLLLDLSPTELSHQALGYDLGNFSDLIGMTVGSPWTCRHWLQADQPWYSIRDFWTRSCLLWFRKSKIHHSHPMDWPSDLDLKLDFWTRTGPRTGKGKLELGLGEIIEGTTTRVRFVCVHHELCTVMAGLVMHGNL